MTYIERSFGGGGAHMYVPFSPLLHPQNDKGERRPQVLVQDNYQADDPNTRPFQTGLVNNDYLDGHHRAETVDKQLGQGVLGGWNLRL